MRHLQKPKHKENVIATEKGWVVERTGELLVAVRGLASLIANSTKEPKTPEVNTTSDEKPKSKRGGWRPRKPKVEESPTEQVAEAVVISVAEAVAEGEQESSEEKVSEEKSAE